MSQAELIDILLVEDSPEDLLLTTRALKKARPNHTIRIARDGAEALDYFFSEPGHPVPRLILLDLKLPKVDGLGVLQKLKSDRRTASIPVVILTSSKEQYDLSESYRLGVNSYIVKPVSSEAFTEAVQRLGMYWMTLNETTVSAAE